MVVGEVNSPSVPRTFVMAVTLALLAPACTCARPPSEARAAELAPSVHVASATATTESAQPTALPTIARGMWVWGTKGRLVDPSATERLLESCERAHVNEVYLSVYPELLENPRLPPLVAALQKTGIRVEALMGEATWYKPENRAQMFQSIDAVGAWDAKHPAERFAGIHLDVEPHQLSENKGNHRFLPVLAEALEEATARAAKSNLTCAADVPRFAIEEDGPAIAHSLSRTFVMLYELRDRSAHGLTKASTSLSERAFGTATNGRLVVGLSADDYPDDLETMLKAVETAHGGGDHAARYGGWAIHDETKYRRTHHL